MPRTVKLSIADLANLEVVLRDYYDYALTSYTDYPEDDEWRVIAAEKAIEKLGFAKSDWFKGSRAQRGKS